MFRKSAVQKFLQKSFFCRDRRAVVYLAGLLLALVLFAQLAPNALAYTSLSPAEVKTMVENGTAGTIIDVREYSDYCTSGHIPCALNYPWSSGYFQIHYTELDLDSKYLIVCQSGIRSAQASAFLESQEFTNIYTMSGGMSVWLGEKQTCDVECPALYFPHVDTSLPWQTEIAIINTGDQTISGTLKAWSNQGQLVMIKTVTLPGRGRSQIVVDEEFTDHTNIGYMVFNADTEDIQGYTKFYQQGKYRAAIPAVKEVNASDIYISHIASNAQWWTGISLLNTTSETKELTITFNDGRSVVRTLNAHEHTAFTIADLFDGPQPDIHSAVITNASGIIGLELFGGEGDSSQLDGILLTDNTASTIYYPHVASDEEWWTGIVAYNPADAAGTITITSYSEGGSALSPLTVPIAGKGKYVGLVADLNLPAQTAWFKIDSTQPLSGFELFSTQDGRQLAAFAGSGNKEGVFAKLEKSGWSGIALVNTEAGGASVTLRAYDDHGNVVATQTYGIGGHAKLVNMADVIFSPQDISSATYITYFADKNVVGFQLNGAADGTMLDGLPALGGGN